MPFLYFATCRDDGNICAKFGHCKNDSRLAAYRTTSPVFDCAMLWYNPTISNYRPLDNYIYDKVLRKRSTCPIVEFEHPEHVQPKSDWFYISRDKAKRILLYMTELEELRDTTDFNAFSSNILFVLATSPANAVPLGMEKDSTKNVLRLADLQARPQWKHEYKDIVRTRTVRVCNWCQNRAWAGCCPKYSPFERNRVVIVVGWQSNADDPAWFGGHAKQFSNFFKRNYTEGGMIPLKEVRRHVEWKDAYAGDVAIKDVHVCKDCNAAPAYSGCCPEYSNENRKKVRMVVGWS